MSEYQYYEFTAIDCALSPKQINEVRQWSSRATITPTSFVNEYDGGDFKGVPEQFLTKYFDVMLYYANWGTHRLMLGLPAAPAQAEEFKQYKRDSVGVSVKAKRVLIDFCTPDGDPPEYEEDYDELSPSQQAFADFLRVDQHLLAAAAENSADRSGEDSGLAEWIAALPLKEKNQLLIDAASGANPTPGVALSRRFRASRPHPVTPDTSRRRIVDLVARANEIRDKNNASDRRSGRGRGRSK